MLILPFFLYFFFKFWFIGCRVAAMCAENLLGTKSHQPVLYSRCILSVFSFMVITPLLSKESSSVAALQCL